MYRNNRKFVDIDRKFDDQNKIEKYRNEYLVLII